MDGLLTTREAAAIVGLTDGRIRQLIYAGILPAQKIGNMNLIKIEDLELLKNRKRGRPKRKEKPV